MFRSNTYRDRDDGDWMAWLSLTVLAVAALIFYIISVLGTHLLLHYLNRYLLEGKLDEDDNLVLLWSAIVWASLGLLAFVPMILGNELPLGEYGLEILVGLLSQVAAGRWAGHLRMQDNIERRKRMQGSPC